MSRGLSDRGRLHVLLSKSPFSPFAAARRREALWAVPSLSSSSRNDLLTVLGLRRAWPHGAGCSSCRCGAETASDGQSRDAARRAWLHFHVMKALVMHDLVVAHRCPGPPSALVADSRLLSPRTSLGRGYGDGMGCWRQGSVNLQRGPLTLRSYDARSRKDL